MASRLPIQNGVEKMIILCYDCEAVPAVDTEDGVPLCISCLKRYRERRGVL